MNKLLSYHRYIDDNSNFSFLLLYWQFCIKHTHIMTKKVQKLRLDPNYVLASSYIKLIWIWNTLRRTEIRTAINETK